MINLIVFAWYIHSAFGHNDVQKFVTVTMSSHDFLVDYYIDMMVTQSGQTHKVPVAKIRLHQAGGNFLN